MPETHTAFVKINLLSSTFQPKKSARTGVINNSVVRHSPLSAKRLPVRTEAEEAERIKPKSKTAKL